MKAQYAITALMALLIAVSIDVLMDHSKKLLRLETQQVEIQHYMKGFQSAVFTNDQMFVNALNNFYAKYESEKTNWIQKGSPTNLPTITETIH